MADITVDGKVLVYLVPTIAVLGSPTVTEILAGERIDLTLVPTGLEGFEPSFAEVDTSSLGGSFDTKRPGIPGYSGTALVLKKQTSPDTLFDTLTEEIDSHIVIRQGIDNDTAIAASDEVQVYPIATRADTWTYLPPARNEVLKYRVAASIHTPPVLKAVVAGP